MIEVSIELDNAPAGLRETISRACEATLAYERAEGDIGVLILDDMAIQEMNRRYRNIDRATDVLSFPACDGDTLLGPPDGFLGDIAISLTRAEAQAREYGHSLERELSFLAVHGTLHLLGYDHMEEEERAAMFAKQTTILYEMGTER